MFLHSIPLSKLQAALAEGACCSVVGLSNVGKSTLLREAAEQSASPDDTLIVYVDCNLMLALSDQAFYEVTLRAVLDTVKRRGGRVKAALISRLEELYRGVIEAERPIAAPLNFNDSIAQLCENLNRRVALLFDEFDDPFEQLDGRVFLNLRALHDKYEALVYVTATGAPLAERRHDAEAGEFCELFVGHQLALGMLPDEAASQAVLAWGQEDGAALTENDVQFLLAQAGGHPGLLRAATRLLVRTAAGVPSGARDQALSILRDRLESDLVIRSECAKLWAQLPPSEQDFLFDLLGERTDKLAAAPAESLTVKGILRGDASERDASPRIFGQLFAAYARRQRHTRQPLPGGVHVDVDAGEVWVDGQRVPTLTDLEYRLLLLLYGRIGKICDKYQIVEAVWGQEYIDEVDDARIEKLVSRLRSKIERDAANPRYLMTVRGRGYKLAAA